MPVSSSSNSGPPPLPAAVLLDELRVGILALRVLVEPLHVRVGGRRVEVEVVLLHVLAVVALGGHEAEEPLLQDRVALVPQREREDQELVAVADAGQAVLAPAVGLAAGLVVGEEVPGVAVGAVVLAHGAPGALGDVRTPAPPRRRARRAARPGARARRSGPGAPCSSAQMNVSTVAVARRPTRRALSASCRLNVTSCCLIRSRTSSKGSGRPADSNRFGLAA